MAGHGRGESPLPQLTPGHGTMSAPLSDMGVVMGGMVTEAVMPPGGGHTVSVRRRNSLAGLWGW